MIFDVSCQGSVPGGNHAVCRAAERNGLFLEFPVEFPGKQQSVEHADTCAHKRLQIEFSFSVGEVLWVCKQLLS